MGNKPLLVIVSLLGLSSLVYGDTGFRDMIQMTETDGSPKCMAGQVKVQPGQLTCSGNTATLNIVGGGGGASSLAVTAGVARSSPTSDLMFNPAQFSGSISGSSITISYTGTSSGGVSVYPATATASFPFGASLPTVTSSMTINNSGGLRINNPAGDQVFDIYTLDPSGPFNSQYTNMFSLIHEDTGSGITGTFGLYVSTKDYGPTANMAGFNVTPARNADRTSGKVTIIPSRAAKTYMFEESGLTFPDGSKQTTAATGSGGGCGYFVEPATVTFNLAKGFTASTGTITGANGLTVTYGVTVGSLAISGTGNLSFTNGASPTYQVVGSSTNATVGKCARFSSSWTITEVDCGSSSSSDGFFAMQPTTATINISSGMVLSGSAGNAGEFLRSGGAGTIPTWAAPGGTGDAVLGSSQTFKARNVFTSTAGIVLPNLTAGQFLYLDADKNVTSSPLTVDQDSSTIGVSWDGGGSALTAGTTYWTSIPSSGTIYGFDLTALPAGTMSITVSTSTAFDVTKAGKICASACPVLTAQSQDLDSVLTGWTTGVGKDGYMWFVINSNATSTQANLSVRYRRQ